MALVISDEVNRYAPSCLETVFGSKSPCKPQNPNKPVTVNGWAIHWPAVRRWATSRARRQCERDNISHGWHDASSLIRSLRSVMRLRRALGANEVRIFACEVRKILTVLAGVSGDAIPWTSHGGPSSKGTPCVLALEKITYVGYNSGSIKSPLLREGCYLI